MQLHPDPVQEIQELEADFRRVHLTGDADGLAELDADDVLSINAEGHVRGKDWLVEAYRTGTVRDESMDTDDVNIRVYGDVAVVTLRLALRRHYGDRTVDGRFRITRVWVKEGSPRQIVVTQSTRIVA
jgi:ketosteroid isomerase-like protein